MIQSPIFPAECSENDFNWIFFFRITFAQLEPTKNGKNIKNNTGMSIEVIASRSLVSWGLPPISGKKSSYVFHLLPIVTKYHGHPQYKQTLDSTNKSTQKGCGNSGVPFSLGISSVSSSEKNTCRTWKSCLAMFHPRSQKENRGYLPARWEGKADRCINGDYI